MAKYGGAHGVTSTLLWLNKFAHIFSQQRKKRRYKATCSCIVVPVALGTSSIAISCLWPSTILVQDGMRDEKEGLSYQTDFKIAKRSIAEDFGYKVHSVPASRRVLSPGSARGRPSGIEPRSHRGRTPILRTKKKATRSTMSDA